MPEHGGGGRGGGAIKPLRNGTWQQNIVFSPLSRSTSIQDSSLPCPPGYCKLCKWFKWANSFLYIRHIFIFLFTNMTFHPSSLISHSLVLSFLLLWDFKKDFLYFCIPLGAPDGAGISLLFINSPFFWLHSYWFSVHY